MVKTEEIQIERKTDARHNPFTHCGETQITVIWLWIILIFVRKICLAAKIIRGRIQIQKEALRDEAIDLTIVSAWERSIKTTPL